MKESSRYFLRTEDNMIFTLEEMKEVYITRFARFGLQSFEQWLSKRLTNRLMGRDCVAWVEIYNSDLKSE